MNQAERELWESLYALNRASSYWAVQDLTRIEMLKIRDRIWKLGVKEFGWKD